MTVAEPYTMAAEPDTTAAERFHFSSSSLPEGHTRQRDGYTTSYWEYDAFELNHDGLAMVRNIGPFRICLKNLIVPNNAIFNWQSKTFLNDLISVK